MFSNFGMRDFVFEKRFDILKSYIDLQLLAPPYSHENNIEVGLEYERKLAELFPVDFLRVDQEYDVDHIKRDCLYLPTNESLEIKTNNYSFNSKDNRVEITWGKVKGSTNNEDIGDKLIKSCPHGLLYYRKFSHHRRCPAILAYMTKDKIIQTFKSSSEVQSRDTADIKVRFHKDDFEWIIQEENIPEVKSGLMAKINAINDRYRNLIAMEKISALNEFKTGKTLICDRNLRPFDRNLGKAKQLETYNKVKEFVQLNMTEEEIFNELNVSWDTIRKHYKSVKHELANT